MVASNTSHARGTATTRAQFDIGCTEEDEGVSYLVRRFNQNIATSLHLDDRTEANGEDRVNLLSSLHQPLVVGATHEDGVNFGLGGHHASCIIKISSLSL